MGNIAFRKGLRWEFDWRGAAKRSIVKMELL
jgi:hypothetical protein